MFKRFAALVKLRSSATARNADKTLSSSRTIIHSQSTALADCTGYSRFGWRVTLILPMKLRDSRQMNLAESPVGRDVDRRSFLKLTGAGLVAALPIKAAPWVDTAAAQSTQGIKP